MEEYKVQFWLGRLPDRKAREVKALHYLVTREGPVVCVDLNLQAESLAELDRAVTSWFRAADPELLLPTSTEALWRRFAALQPDGMGETKVCWKRYTLPVDGPLPEHHKPLRLQRVEGRSFDVAVMRET